MSESIHHADAATAYVLGTQSARERRRFEARLRKSAELRKIVRLLELGSVGLAMTAPRREPPTRLWEGIQLAVTRERERQERRSRRIWLRSAVGIAACAVIGWFAFTYWSSRASSTNQQLVADTTGATNSTTLVARPVSPQPAVTNLASQPRRRTLRPGESATLRERVGDLENQVAHLAQTVTQQQPVAPDFNQLTFLNIVPEGSDGTTMPQMAPPPPELRRALLLGVARQLGWMPTTPPPPIFAPPPSSPEPQYSSPPPSAPPPVEAAPPAPQNNVGVEFVDLPPVEAPAPESQTASVETPSAPAPNPVPTPNATAATISDESTSRNAASIPAYVSGTNLVFAIDPSVVPVGTETVSFYSGNGGGPVNFRGTIALGNNPTVVTMPFLQIRSWNNQPGTWADSARLQSSPGVVRFNSTSAGNMASFVFTFPDPPSSSSP